MLEERYRFMIKTWSSDVKLPYTIETREEAIEYAEKNNWFDKRGGYTLFEVTAFHSAGPKKK